MKGSSHYIIAAWIMLALLHIIFYVQDEINLIFLLFGLGLLILIAVTGIYKRIGEKNG